MSTYESHEYFLNRECTWITFNERVLREAVVPSNPIMEQLKFIAISASNLDEFFMIRVAGVKHLIESGVKHIDISGLTPRQQFAAIQGMAHELVQTQYRYSRSILARLRDKGIAFIPVSALTEEQQKWLESFFEREIYPVVTPMAVDSSHPFPFLASLNLNLAVLLKKRDGTVKTAILPVPSPIIKRIVKVPSSTEIREFLFLEDILAAFAERFFLGYEILETVPFRVTRDADFDINEDVEDVLVEVEKSLKKTKKRGGSTFRNCEYV